MIEGGRWRVEEVHVSVGDKERERQTRRRREEYTRTCRGMVWGAGREGVNLEVQLEYSKNTYPAGSTAKQ